MKEFNKEILELEKKLNQKIVNAIKDIDVVGKNKSGYNFNYSDGLEIRKSVNAAIKDKNLFIDAPRWATHPETGAAMYSVEKDGKNFKIKGTIVLSIRDVETGYYREYSFPGSDEGTNIMQAKNSAESYAMRPWLRELFAVEIERDELDVSQTKMVYDKNNTPVAVLNVAEISKVAAVVMSKTNDASRIKLDVAGMLAKYNEFNKTNYGKLSEFPHSEIEDLLKHAAAFEPSA